MHVRACARFYRHVWMQTCVCVCLPARTSHVQIYIAKVQTLLCPSMQLAPLNELVIISSAHEILCMNIYNIQANNQVFTIL